LSWKEGRPSSLPFDYDSPLLNLLALSTIPMPPRPKPLRLPLSAFSPQPPPPASQTAEANRTVDSHLNATVDVAQVLDGYSSSGRKIMGAVGITR
jgi:hypothetical protein